MPGEDWFITLAEQVAMELMRRFEGFYSKPYICPAGVVTIAFGATHYLDGRRVKLTDPPVTRETGEVMLKHMVRYTYLPAVLKLCPGIDSPHRLAAIIDFCFNLGPGNLSASTLRKRINSGDWDAVPGELRKWTRGGNKVLKGLVIRREAECQLITKGS
jgi:lysozyme